MIVTLRGNIYPPQTAHRQRAAFGGFSLTEAKKESARHGEVLEIRISVIRLAILRRHRQVYYDTNRIHSEGYSVIIRRPATSKYIPFIHIYIYTYIHIHIYIYVGCTSGLGVGVFGESSLELAIGAV